MKDKSFSIPLSLGILLFAIGSVLFLVYSPYALQFALSGLVVIFVFYLLRFSYKKTKLKPDIIKVSLVSLWSITSFLKILYQNSAPIINWIFLGVLICWGSLEIKGYFYKVQSKPTRQEQINHKVFLIAGGTVALGLLFMIMHWPYSDYLRIFGILFVGTWALLMLHNKK